MTNFGKIKSYDSSKGVGTIAPEKGGDTLAFAKADLQQQGQEPKVDQRYGYETRQAEGGKTHAVSLQMEQAGQAAPAGQAEQAANQQG